MITTFNEVLSQEQCNDIIERFSHSQIYKDENEARVCEGLVAVVPMTEDEVLLNIANIMREHGTQYEQVQGIDPTEMENVQIIRYPQNEGFFVKHQDGLDRKFSAILYLNEVETGGETVFHGDFPYVVKPVPGKLIFFSSNLDHEATMPESSDKVVAVTWFK